MQHMAITTRFQNGRIRVQARRASEGSKFRASVSYQFENIDREHCAAAKSLAEQLGWSGVYVVGTCDLGEQLKLVRAWVNIGGSMASDRELLTAALRSTGHIEGEDYFISAVEG